MSEEVPKPKAESVKLQHRHHYFGGPYSYKNSTKVPAEKK